MRPSPDYVDAWMLAAVAMAVREAGRSPVELSNVVTWADVIEHAIPAKHEIEHALGRLAPSGIIHVTLDGRFALTEEGQGLVDRADHANLPAFLRSLIPMLPDAPPANFDLEQDRYDDAVAVHHQWFQTRLRERREKH